MTSIFQPGSIVRARHREWVVLPGSDVQRLKLRSLGGSDEDQITIHTALERDVSAATFPLPTPEMAAHSTQHAALLMRDALLLKLRAGAGPFRALGRINVEPRAYQLVPLLMALKQSVVRLLIADEVGIGKTIEACLIVREMLDRGEIQRFTVLCSPHLCEQWRGELASKFNIQAEVVTTGSVAKLERTLPPNTSVFQEYPYTVVSLDYIKSDRRRDEFENACPELVIVDEAHTCAGGNQGQHQRYRLLQALSAREERHLILLTATPHSGNEDAYFNLLGLVKPEFAGLRNITGANNPLYRDLGNHLVQRRRIDIAEWRDNSQFPERESAEATYLLDGQWGQLFSNVLEYACELIQDSDAKNETQRRMNWWAALALLRCISSSPAAAVRALNTRLHKAEGSEEEQLASLDKVGSEHVFDGSDEANETMDDTVPGAALDSADTARLAALIEKAEGLTNKNDPKLQELLKVLDNLLKKGHAPVIFCRYIATAHYVAEAIRSHLKRYNVLCITGEQSPSERALTIDELAESELPAVLVATDCLSEGINLQAHFNAVIHYDLTWNPTRLEQREGRVDRFGQRVPMVRAVMIYGKNNPVDATIVKVIVRKAESIRKALGVSVPMPDDEGAVTKLILENVLAFGAQKNQLLTHTLALDLDVPDKALAAKIDALEQSWTNAQDKAKRNKTIFAQNALKPENVLPEFERMSEVLGDSSDVQRFVLSATKALKAPLSPEKNYFKLPYNELPEPVRDRLSVAGIDGLSRVFFDYPGAPRATQLHRTHPLVSVLADQVAEDALANVPNAAAARAGVWYSTAVTTRTTLILARLRSRISYKHLQKSTDMLVEECVIYSLAGQQAPEVLGTAPALALMEAPASKSASPEQRQREIDVALAQLTKWQAEIDAIATARADGILEDHRRVRDASKGGGTYDVTPQLPIDVIGLYVLIPQPTF